MELEYIVEKEDFIAFNQIYMRYQNKKRDTILKVIGLLFLLASFYQMYMLYSIYQVYQLFFTENVLRSVIYTQYEHIFLTLIFLILAFLLSFNMRIQIKIWLKQVVNNPENQIYFLKKEIHFSEEKIDARQGDMTSSFPWEMVVKIFETKQYLFLFNSSSTGILIPKKVISKELYPALYEMILANTFNVKQVKIDQ